MGRGKKGDAPDALNGDAGTATLEQLNEAADTTAAGAIEGAGAVEAAGGTAEEVVAGAIGGAAAGAAEAAESDEQPAADDHITQFERRCERLSEIAEEAEFESGTLVGDIRDALLDIFKNRPKPWSQLSAGEQGDVNRSLEAVAKKVLRKLVIVIAEEDDVSVHATLKGYAVDGETFKLKVVAKGDEDTAAELFRMDGHEVILIRADARRFHGQRKDGEVMPDQPPLFSDTAPSPPKEILSKPPADDNDLVDAAGPAPDDDSSDEVSALDKLNEGEVVNLTTGMIEREIIGVGEGDPSTFEDVREATPDELAAAREEQGDFKD